MSPNLTLHARARMQQRGIKAEALETLLDFGRTSHVDRGREIVFFDKAARARLARLNPLVAKAAERLRRTYAILGSDGTVITVGHRYRRIPRGSLPATWGGSRPETVTPLEWGNRPIRRLFCPRRCALELVLSIAAGLVVGGTAAWLFLRTQAQGAFERGRATMETERAALVERLAGRVAEVARLEKRGAELESARDAAETALRAEAEKRAAAEQSAARVPQLEAALGEAARVGETKESANAELRAENARLKAELEAERAMLTEKLGVLNQAQEQLTTAFRAMSAQALQANNQTFLDLAAQTLGRFQQGAQGDLEKRQQAIQELVGPVKQSLEKLDGRIHDIEKVREGAYQALTTQVRSLAEGQGDLRRETSNLVRALRQPVARGRWGELQLRRVVEMAGMLDHCDFIEQPSAMSEDGLLRPDLVVRLPGGRNIVVDAKTPLTAYLDAVESENDDLRKQKLFEHARQVRDHMTKLGRKSYQDQFDPTPELVVLFMPGEMFFSAALEQDPELIEFGVGEKVIPATPTTLIAMLRAIAYGWKQEALARNAQEISELGRELHERLSVMAGHWAKVGKNLSDAVGSYNKAVASLESRVLVSARRFSELKAVPDGRHIDEIDQIQVLPRALPVPELETQS